MDSSSGNNLNNKKWGWHLQHWQRVTLMLAVYDIFSVNAAYFCALSRFDPCSFQRYPRHICRPFFTLHLSIRFSAFWHSGICVFINQSGGLPVIPNWLELLQPPLPRQCFIQQALRFLLSVCPFLTISSELLFNSC